MPAKRGRAERYCGRCGKTGHNSRTCKAEIEEENESDLSEGYKFYYTQSNILLWCCAASLCRRSAGGSSVGRSLVRDVTFYCCKTSFVCK